ncbi:hypothetical protein UB46_23795 [Burkholderiaceae bacterium 16]|nr:hypothetical protein UB46_23795 [Burkholderiaceae bacterium 16]
MPDPFQNTPPSVTDPSFDYFVITPSDSAANNFARPANSIRVGTGGDVVAIRRDGTAVTFKNCPSGETLPVRAIRVNVSGTTASDLVGL